MKALPPSSTISMPDTCASHIVLMALGSNHATADALIEKALQLMSSYITDLCTTETLTTERIPKKNGARLW